MAQLALDHIQRDTLACHLHGVGAGGAGAGRSAASARPSPPDVGTACGPRAPTTAVPRSVPEGRRRAARPAARPGARARGVAAASPTRPSPPRGGARPCRGGPASPAAGLEIPLGECQRLRDPQSGPPEHHDQGAQANAGRP
jgi:hypothetical protein